jgi:hypothetical protein
MVTSPPLSPSPSKERGKIFLKEGLAPLFDTPIKMGWGLGREKGKAFWVGGYGKIENY